MHSGHNSDSIVLNCIICLSQTDPSARNMRHKSWPYYKDWEIIFGKDRASGDVSKAWQDMVREQAYVPIPLEQNTTTDHDETASVNTGSKHGEASSSMRSCKRKRTRVQEVKNNPMADLKSSFFTDISSQIGTLISKVGAESNAKAQRQNLVRELGNLPLSLAEKLTVAKKICSDVEHVDIFYGLGDEERAEMVKMVLLGKY